MSRRLRYRERIFWPQCYGWHHPWWGPYSPPPHFWRQGQPSLEEEEEAIKEHIEFLKEELAEAEDHLASLKNEKK